MQADKLNDIPPLKISIASVDDLVPYAENAKKHTPKQINEIAESITQFGMNDPIGIWHDQKGRPIIVEGHGRLLALKKLGISKTPVIILDHLTDVQRKAYALVHNQLTMNTPFDLQKLRTELDKVKDDFDLKKLGFNLDPHGEILNPKYSEKTGELTYKPRTDKKWQAGDLYDKPPQNIAEDVEKLHAPEELKTFLRYRLANLAVFHFDRIADYFATAPVEQQKVFKELALVILDNRDAIKYGYMDLQSAKKNGLLDDGNF